MLEKIDQDKVVEFLGEVFENEKSCEVLYYGVKILKKIDTQESLKVVDNRFGSKEVQRQRYERYLKDDMKHIPAGDWNAIRVLRGGSWYCYGQSCRSAYRGRGTSDYRDGNVSFRPVFIP